jgi:hypothetical protein
MEYLVLLPNKIVAFAADIFNDGKWWPIERAYNSDKFWNENSKMKIYFIKIKINGILRRCPYFYEYSSR